MNATTLEQPVAVKPGSRRNYKNTVSAISPQKPFAAPAEKPGPGSQISDKTQVVVARVDVGWGNTLYIRGEGGSLSWDVGVPMMCSGEDRWVWSCHADQVPKEFKFLINDQIWAEGENHAMSGADITVCSPTFPS